MRLIFLTISAFVLLLTSCGNSTTSPSGPAKYIPLAVGNQWNTNVSGFVVSSAGDTLTITGTLVRKIKGTATHANGSVCYIDEELLSLTYTTSDTSFSFADTTLNYFAESDSQLLIYDDTLSTEFELLYKLPITVGETWVPDPNDDPNTVREVISITSDISVTAGSFTNCLYMKDTNSSYPNDYWKMYFAPGVGPIKMEMLETVNDYTNITFTTTSYVIK